jgi:lipopolysaccharide transport system ATP-binding protein
VTNNLGVVVTCFWKFDEGTPFRTRRGGFKLRRFHLHHRPYAVITWVLESRGHATLERLTEICPFDVTMGTLTRGGFDWYSDMAVYLEDLEWRPIIEA